MIAQEQNGLSSMGWHGIVLALPIIMVFILSEFYIGEQKEKSQTSIAHTHEVRVAISSLLSLLNDAETGQRGFLLTSKDNYLEPFYSSLKEIKNSVKRLRELTQDNSKQQKLITQSIGLINKKLDELSQTIKLWQLGNKSKAMDIVLSDKGKELMEQLRVLFNKMDLEELHLLKSRMEHFKNIGKAGVFLEVISLLMLLAIASYIFYNTRKLLIIRTNEKIELQENREQLNQAQRLAKIGSWSLELKSNELYWSDEIFRLFKIDPKKFNASYDSFLNAIHPDDREIVNQTYLNSLDKREPYEIIHRILLPDGRIKHVNETCETLYDVDGSPILSRGTVQDITERVESEKKLNLYANIYQHSSEAILITDHNNIIVAVNPALNKLTGYSSEELLGENPRILSSAQTSKEKYKEMWGTLAKDGHWQGELYDCRKNGTIYPKWLSISVIYDNNGHIENYVGTFTDISERKNAEERIMHLAHHDTLTGLYNRYSLEDRLDQSIAHASRLKQQIAVLFLDLDRFKIINDSLGHRAGDDLLIQVSKKLKVICQRKSDIVARIGGDEFVIILSDLESPTFAALTATTIVQVISMQFDFEGNELHTSPSIGISIYPTDGNNVESLLKSADTAMYHVKENGRGAYQFYTDEMNKAIEEKLTLEKALRLAIIGNQFEIYYQPQICTLENDVCGVEALLRWEHPILGFVSPEKFIPIAEETNLISVIGEWVINEAFEQLSKWTKKGITKTKVAVNVSAKQLESTDFVDFVSTSLKKYQLNPSLVEFEVTETTAMKNPDEAINNLNSLRSLGIDLAIDDFGTGHSSLSYLQKLPVQVLKLDKVFVMNIENDKNKATISIAAISLAHSLGFKVVAEGVETQAQSDFLKVNGCDILQGYYYSRPNKVEVIEEFISNYSS